MSARKFLNWRFMLILVHRWMGIAFGLLFLMWFLSGVAFMYWGMPSLSAGERMDRQSEVDLSTAAVTPLEAASRNGLRPGSLSIAMREDRPIYRFGQSAIYADTGERVETVPADADEAVQIVRRWVPERAATIRYDELLTDVDQWTLQTRQMPLHRIAVGDERDTYYYVAASNGQLVMKTDRASRMKGFASGVLHWVYFTPLRKHGYVWNQFIIWSSFAGALMCLLGLVLGLQRLSPRARYRRRGKPVHSPYTGLLGWHHYSGLLFGLVTFTWVLSGGFSVNPFGMFAGGSGLDGAQRSMISGGPFDLEAVELDALKEGAATLAEELPVKEIDVLQFRGALYLTASRPPSALNPVPRVGPPERRMVSLAHPERGTFTKFDDAVIEELADEIVTDVPVRDREWLQSYDLYYRSRDGARPLPVLRIRYEDEQGTWLYFDPHTGSVSLLHRQNRVRRWLYDALHEFDIPYLYERRPLWDIVVIGLSIGGIVLAGTTLWPGFKRVGRHLRRLGRRLSALLPSARNATQARREGAAAR